MNIRIIVLIVSVVLFSLASLVGAQEKAYVDYFKIFNANEGYDILDIKGHGSTWDFQNDGRRLVYNNSLGNNDGNYAEAEDWIVFGPFDLLKAESPEFSMYCQQEGEANVLSVHVSENFPGAQPGVTVMPGDWEEVLTAEEINLTPSTNTWVTADLSSYAGKRSVYVGVRYYTPVTANAYGMQVIEASVTRNVNEAVEELADINISRTGENTDHYNLSPSSSDKWSYRRGYTRASEVENVWLITKGIDLRNSEDAFFSFSSALGGKNGPQGIQIKVSRQAYTEGTSVDDYQWEDYSKGRFAHDDGGGFFNTEKLDLSGYLGNEISIAFRSINGGTDSYDIEELLFYHLPDLNAPEISNLSIQRVLHNKLFFDVVSNEVCEVVFGLYNDDSYTPSFDDLLAGTGALKYGTYNYESIQNTQTFVVNDLSAETDYHLFVGLVDASGNRTGVRSVDSFTTPVEDLNPPGFNVQFNDIQNHSFIADIEMSEPGYFYLLHKLADSAAPSIDDLQRDGKLFEQDNTNVISEGFYDLEQNTGYALYILGTDMADNMTDVLKFEVLTANEDIIAPTITSLNVTSTSNTGLNIEVAVDEGANVFYTIQHPDEIPPSFEGVISGERGIVSGSFEYLDADAVMTYQIDGLSVGKNYHLYLLAQDEAENISLIKSEDFNTQTNDIAVLALKNKARIDIPLETEYELNIDQFEISNVDSPDNWQLVVETGSNYSVTANTILPHDDFSGRLFVPVLVQKDQVKSNQVIVEFIVERERVSNHFSDVIANMRGANLTPRSDIGAARALIEMKEDGSFFDKPGYNSDEYADYMTLVLDGRIKEVAKWYFDDRYRRRKRVEARHKMYKMISFWLDNKPKEWEEDKAIYDWANDLGAIMLSLYYDMMDDLENDEEKQEEVKTLLEKVRQFNLYCWNGDGQDVFQNHQGTNLSARLFGTMALAAVTNNIDDAFMVYDAVVADAKVQVNNSEVYPGGWKPDGSFHMNNYSGGQWNLHKYGVLWVDDMLDYGRATRRTPWKLHPEHYQLLGNSLLEGMQWLNWMGVVPYNLTGQQSSDNNVSANAGQISRLVNDVREEAFINNVLLNRNQELVDMYSNLSNEYYSIDSVKYFWNSNVLIKNSARYNVSINMPSSRTGAPEAGKDSINGEFNHLLGDGTTYFFGTELDYYGRVYHDFRRLPGTTAQVIEDMEQWPVNILGTEGKSNNNFSGGVCNGTSAVASFYYDRDGLGNVNAYKSYFVFDEATVALGNSIKKRKSELASSVYTTLDQDLLATNVIYQGNGEEINSISANTENSEVAVELNQRGWVYHNNKGYIVFPEQGGNNLEINVKNRRGSWDILNGSWRIKQEDNDYTIPYVSYASVLELGINHGRVPDNASYAYMVVPTISESGFVELVENNPIEILSNSDSVQVVYHKTKQQFGIVFTKACKCEVMPNLSLEADCPLIMFAQLTDDEEYDFWIADPLQNQLFTNLVFTMTLKSGETKKVQRVVKFPDGINVGQAVRSTTGDVWMNSEPIKDDEENSNNTENQEGEAEGAEQEDTDSEKSSGVKQFSVSPTVLKSGSVINILYNNAPAGSCMVNIYSLQGQLIKQQKRLINKGDGQFTISMPRIAKGVYLVKVTQGDVVESVRIVMN